MEAQGLPAVPEEVEPNTKQHEFSIQTFMVDGPAGSETDPEMGTMMSMDTDTELEIDEGTTGDDTSDYFSATTGVHTTGSIASSITDYIYAHGRRYRRQNGEPITMPDDEIEQERLELTHYWFLVQSGGHLHRAPISVPKEKTNEPFRILDCGTGAGAWALDMGEQYPAAEIVGVDLGAMQPNWTYPNVTFEIDDLELEWTWPDNYFSFVYSRTMNNCIRDYPLFMQRMYKHLKPGGYVEIWEHQLDKFYDVTPEATDPNSALLQYFKYYKEALGKAGIKPMSGDDLKRELERIGFEEVTVKCFKQPFSTWPKDPHMKQVGQLLLGCVKTGLEAHGLELMTRYCGLTAQEAKALCDESYNELLSGKLKMYNISYNVVGRKPMV